MWLNKQKCFLFSEKFCFEHIFTTTMNKAIRSPYDQSISLILHKLESSFFEIKFIYITYKKLIIS